MTALPTKPESGTPTTTTTQPPGVVEILRRFRHEKTDPEPFYVGLAARTISSFPYDLDGARILDLGCGPGWYSTAMTQAGASVVGLDLDAGDVKQAHQRAVAAMIGDGQRLPIASASVDGIFCSNLMEHVPDPALVIDEMTRIVRPGGWLWISWTPWYSPWGGHEIVPFHLLGPRLGPKVWNRLFGPPRKNVPFDGLWPTYVSEIVGQARSHPGLDIRSVHPRYYPFMKPIMAVPGLREVASWNCVIEARRR